MESSIMQQPLVPLTASMGMGLSIGTMEHHAAALKNESKKKLDI